MTTVMVATGAAAQDTGWYGALDLGYHRTEVLRTHSAALESDGQPYNFHFGHTDSWTGFARVGYKLSPNLRLELEGGYRPGNLSNVYDSAARPVTAICNNSTVSPACGTPNGSLHAWTLMGNLLVDLMPDGQIDPFIGGGLGVARTSLSLNGRLQPTAQTLTSDDADTKFAWQGIVGVSVKANERLNVDVTYRYIGSQRSNFATVGSGALQPGVIDGPYKDQSITIGLRYALSA
ncbi:MAG TPA: outer membrane beta-barrel protein, partial [Caulobacteraceae bacterium]